MWCVVYNVRCSVRYVLCAVYTLHADLLKVNNFARVKFSLIKFSAELWSKIAIKSHMIWINFVKFCQNMKKRLIFKFCVQKLRFCAYSRKFCSGVFLCVLEAPSTQSPTVPSPPDRPDLLLRHQHLHSGPGMCSLWGSFCSNTLFHHTALHCTAMNTTPNFITKEFFFFLTVFSNIRLEYRLSQTYIFC